MNRRTFMQNTSVAGLGLTFPWTGFANQRLTQSNDHFFVLIQVPGGWDVTLSLDPMTHEVGTTQEDVFLEYQPSDILKHNNLILGPACRPIEKYMDSIHVIKGIEMRRDAGHLSNLDIMSSGYGDGQTALFPIELGMGTTSGPLGILIQNSIPTGFHNPVLTEISSIGKNGGNLDLISNLNKGQSLSFEKAMKAAKKAAKKLKEIDSTLAELESKGFDDPKFSAIVSAFKVQASYQACMQIPLNLDTHSDHEGRHMQELTMGWTEIAKLFDYFKSTEYKNGESLFDRTTFMVVSEFARTPALNGSKGKDHNPHCNSILLAGKGINGGQSSGQSFVIPKHASGSGLSEHISRPIDFKNGEIIDDVTQQKDSVDLIFPEDVAKTVGGVFGYPDRFYKNKIQGQTIPLVLKK